MAWTAVLASFLIMAGCEPPVSLPPEPRLTEVALTTEGDIGQLSEIYGASGVIFRENPGDYHYQWHNAPRRQYIVMLEGSVEIEIGDGTRRVFHPGEILLAEDTTGQGHISRAVNGQPRKSLFIPLDPEP